MIWVCLATIGLLLWVIWTLIKERDGLKILCRIRGADLVELHHVVNTWELQALSIKAATNDRAKANIFNAAPELYAACKAYQKFDLPGGIYSLAEQTRLRIACTVVVVSALRKAEAAQ